MSILENMELHTLKKITEKTKRRVGRGHGSGRSKTSGRGTKGQKARRNIPLHFEGGALPLTKRMPFLRGKGRNPTLSPKSVAVNVGDLNVLKGEITIESLIAGNIVSENAKKCGVKILGKGDLTQALTVKIPVSKSAREKIEKAGGIIQI